MGYRLGYRFFLPGFSPKVTAVGIRPKAIRPGLGENGVRCRVVGVTEHPFSYTVILESVLAPAAAPLAWELPKQDWQKIQAHELTICIPSKALLLLRD